MCDSLWSVYSRNNLLIVSFHVWGSTGYFESAEGGEGKHNICRTEGVMPEPVPLLEKGGPSNESSCREILGF